MKLYRVEGHQLESVMEHVSGTQYDGNLQFNRFDEHRNHVRFTLRVRDSKARGHRLGFSGRRCVSACWHAHRDLLAEVFKRFPEARLVSSGGSYNGKAEFDHKHTGTGYRNIGSMMQPLQYADACEC